MTKPVVFFSHSSSDKKLLTAIKDLFVQKTGGTVDVFLSSDGSSIKFGKNWLSEVESALGRAHLMFVFMTENSLASRWIHFEAGHAYAKNIRVIPVCIGVDLSVVGAPLNILQGFNVTNESGLNNLIAIINEQFDFQHTQRFAPEEYQEITNNHGKSGDFLSEVSGLIGNLSFIVVVRPQGGSLRIEDLLDHLSQYLSEQGIDCRLDKSSLECEGMTVFCHEWNPQGRSAPSHSTYSLDAEMYPSCFRQNFELLDRFSNESQFERVDRKIIFKFTPEVVASHQSHVLTGKLRSMIKLHDRYSFEYKNLVFELDDLLAVTSKSPMRRGCKLEVSPKASDLNLSEVTDLLGVLLENEILRLSE